MCQLLLLSSSCICVKPLGVHRCAAFFPSACLSHFDPTLPPCSSSRGSSGGAVEFSPPCSLFKIISECSSRERANSCSESSSGLFFSSPNSPHCDFQEVQNEAGSLHNMQNRRAHSYTHALRGCTGGEQVGENKSPDGQILFICSSRVPTHPHRRTVLLQPAHLAVNNATRFIYVL